jgi:hypothetical protein
MKRECYGKLFPDLLQLPRNKMNQGHVFGAMVQSVGVGVQDRKLSVNAAEWEKCAVCPDYRTCYDLSLAKLALQQAVLSVG